jgi:hypothetical protein
MQRYEVISYFLFVYTDPEEYQGYNCDI